MEIGIAITCILVGVIIAIDQEAYKRKYPSIEIEKKRKSKKQEIYNAEIRMIMRELDEEFPGMEMSELSIRR
jgi:hypothetical protein